MVVGKVEVVTGEGAAAGGIFGDNERCRLGVLFGRVGIVEEDAVVVREDSVEGGREVRIDGVSEGSWVDDGSSK